MRKRILLILFVVLMFGAVSQALADSDRRLNTEDNAAPVMVYYSYRQKINQWGQTVSEVNGIQIWAVDASTAYGQQVLSLGVEDILTLLAEHPTDDFEMTANAGYSLHHSASGWFWVNTPSGYSFVWSDAPITHPEDEPYQPR